MPAEYEKLKKILQKTYGKKKGAEVAYKKWNKDHKGTGRTVGRGRK